jgi:pectate lyase
LVSNNVLEDIESYAINLGWGKYCRNLTAQGNIIRNCQRGISFSTSEGAGKVLIANNMIEGASLAAIQGMDYLNATTDDLSVAGSTLPANATITNNVITG